MLRLFSSLLLAPKPHVQMGLRARFPGVEMPGQRAFVILKDSELLSSYTSLLSAHNGKRKDSFYLRL